MIYFNPKPNYQILSNYYQFPFSSDEMQVKYTDGFNIHINQYWTDEAIKEIEDGFSDIIIKHGLLEHYDNLLVLVLGKVQQIEDWRDELYFQYDQKKRTKELAGLLLAFTESQVKHYNSLSLKTFLHSAKVADQSLINWVGNTLINSVKEGNMSISHFQFDIRELFFDFDSGQRVTNIEKLRAEATKTVRSPKHDENKMYADLCFYLNHYVVNETNLKLIAATLFSDAQLNLYFDILALFKYINPDKIQSEPKDYMGSLLRNQLK